MVKETWINHDPIVKNFINMAKQYYDGTVEFVKNGLKTYTAKLDPRKLKIADCTCEEAYFDINVGRSSRNQPRQFFLRMVEEDGNEINITLM